MIDFNHLREKALKIMCVGIFIEGYIPPITCSLSTFERELTKRHIQLVPADKT